MLTVECIKPNFYMQVLLNLYNLQMAETKTIPLTKVYTVH